MTHTSHMRFSSCTCGHSIAEHGEDGCYTFLFDQDHPDLVRYCACRIAPAEPQR